jgi:hypothetical protein
MKTLTFKLTEENRKLNNVTLPLAWDVAVKTIALTRFKAGTLIFDRRDLNDVDFILNDVMPKSNLAVGKLVGVHANLESIIIGIEALDNERGRILTKVYNTLDNDVARSKLVGFGWVGFTDDEDNENVVDIKVASSPYIRYDSVIGAIVKERLIDPANLDFCMFDAVAKHVSENKPSNWTVTDKTCIDYHNKLLKLSILSSKDGLHVLMMLDANQTERFHLDTWEDVFDFVKEPAVKPYDSILKNLFIDVLLTQGIK